MSKLSDRIFASKSTDFVPCKSINCVPSITLFILKETKTALLSLVKKIDSNRFLALDYSTTRPCWWWEADISMYEKFCDGAYLKRGTIRMKAHQSMCVCRFGAMINNTARALQLLILSFSHVIHLHKRMRITFAPSIHPWCSFCLRCLYIVDRDLITGALIVIYIQMLCEVYFFYLEYKWLVEKNNMRSRNMMLPRGMSHWSLDEGFGNDDDTVFIMIW